MAAISIAVGVTLSGMGVAGAAPQPSKFVIIRFIQSLHEVTLQIPTPPCKHGPPGCVWKLSVNEPLLPGDPELGVATGTSGLLTVIYPSTVCGTVQGDAGVLLQADVSVGGQTWRYKVGHRLVIVCPPTIPPTTPTHSVPAQPPNDGGTPPSPPGGATFTANGPQAAVKTAAPAQLPFTGIDLTPMALIGMSLVLCGLVLASRLDERRRALRRVHDTVQGQRARASQVSRWFLGE